MGRKTLTAPARSKPSARKPASGRKKEATKKKSTHAEGSTKRFRFQNFKQKLDELSVETIRRSGGWRGISLPSDTSSWFEESLMEWKELNCTKYFAAFCAEVNPWIGGGLPQILFYQEEITDKLLEHLGKPNSLAVVPLAALTAMFARDLSSEFGLERFGKFMAILCDIAVASKEVDDIEAVLKTLFYLVSRVVEKELVKDLAGAFEAYFAPALSKVSKSYHLTEAILDLWALVGRKALIKPKLASTYSAFTKQSAEMTETVGKAMALTCFDGSRSGKFLPKHLKASIQSLMEVEPSSCALLKSALMSAIEFAGDEVVGVINETLTSSDSLRHENVIEIVEGILRASEGKSFGHGKSILGLLKPSLAIPELTEKVVDLACDILWAGSDNGRNLSFVLEARSTLLEIFESSPAASSRAIFNLLKLVQNDRRIAECIVCPLYSLFALESKIKGFLATDQIFEGLYLLWKCTKLRMNQLPSALPSDCKDKVLALMKKGESKAVLILGMSFVASEFPAKEIMQIVGGAPSVESFAILKCWVQNYNGQSSEGLDELVALLTQPSWLYCKETFEVLEILSSKHESGKWAEIGKTCAMHGDSSIRTIGLSLLSKSMNGKALEILQKLETNSPWTFSCDREKGVHLDALFHALPSITDQAEAEVVMKDLLGIVAGGFKPLQKETGRVLTAYSQKYGSVFRSAAVELLHQIDESMTVHGSAMETDNIVDDQLKLVLGERSKLAAIEYGPSSLVSLFEFCAAQPAALDLVQNDLVSLLMETFAGHPGSFSSALKSKIESGLGALLNALGGLKNLHKNPMAEALESLLMSKFLCLGDAAIQQRSLSLLLLLRCADADLMRWRESLGGLLLSEEKMREQLVELTAASSREHPIEPTVLPVLVKLLYGRMVARRGTGAGRANPQVRRKLILNYVASWSPQCIAAFVAEALPAKDAEERKILGFLNLAEALIGKVVRFLPAAAFHGLVEAIYGYACMESSKEGKRIALARILQVYSLAFGTQGENRWMEAALEQHSEVLWSQIIGPKLPDLPVHYSQSSSTLLGLFALLAQHDPMALVRGDKRLVGQLVSCLAQSKVKPEVIDKLVGVFEGLLGNEAAVAEAILPNLAGLLSAIARRLEGLLSLPKASRVLGRLVDMLLGLAGLLLQSGCANTESINVLCELLLRAVPTRVINEPLKASMLQILAHLIPIATELDRERLAEMLGSWFSGVTGLKSRASRTALSTAFRALCTTTCSRTPELGELIAAMNSYAEDVLDEEPDYVRRASAYARVKAMAVPEAWWPAILHSALFALQSADLSLRHQSTFLLESFLGCSSSLPVVRSLVWPGLRPGLKSKDEGVRTGFLEVLARTVAAFPGESPMASLVPLLANGDEEANVLLNLGHIQVHRRVRATRRLGEWATEAASLPKALLEDILIPLLRPSALPADGTSELHPLLQAESIQTLAILTAKLPGRALCARLSMQLKRLMALTAEEAAAAKLDIQPGAKGAGVKKTKASPMVKALLKLIPAIVARIDILDDGIKPLLPLLFRAMNPGAVDQSAIQLPIAEAIGGLLARSSNEELRAVHLPRLFTALAQTQHSRDFGRREAGRQALGALLKRIGTGHLEAVLRELDVALLAGGRSVGTTSYRHIHGHALAFLLPLGPIPDACFDRFVASAVAQAFGVLAREKGRKGSEWTGRMVEVRSQKAFDMVKGLVAVASETQLRLGLLGKLRTVLAGLDGGSQDDRVAVDALFKALQEALQAHPLPSLKAHMVLLHDLITGADEEEDTDDANNNVYGHRFRVLGIKLLNGFVKQHDSDAEIIAYLDGFISPLVESHLFRSKHVALQTAAIKCLSLLISRPAWIPSMPSLDPLVPKILLRSFELLIRQQQQQQQQQSSMADSEISTVSAELTSSCLKLIAAMVRNLPSAALTQSQLKALLLFTRTNLEASTTGKASLAFSLLRALLSRRIVMLEVAEVMADIFRALLSSTSQTCRAECRSVYLQFLLEYPLGEARLAEILGTMMKNLGFEWDTGRHSLLSLWTQLIPRLPVVLVEAHADVLLISLAARVAQETSTKVLPVLHACLDALAGRLVTLSTPLRSTSQLILRWVEGGAANEGVVQAAWIVAGHYVKAIVGYGKPVDCDLVERIVHGAEKVLPSCQSVPLLLAVLGTLCHLEITSALKAILLEDALLLFPNAQVRDRLQQILRASVIPDADKEVLSVVSKATVKHLLDLPAAAVDPPLIDALVQSLLAISRRLPLADEAGNSQLALVRKLEKLVKQRLAEGTWQIGLPLLTGTLRFLAAFLVKLDGEVESTSSGDDLATAILSIAHRIAVSEEITLTEPKEVAMHLQEMLKAKLGADRFARLHTALLQSLSKTRAARKAQLAQMAVNDPLAFARRTMKRNEAKKEQRKRKIDRVREAACKRKRT